MILRAPTIRLDRPRELTGRTVLLLLLGFFGLVMVVNAVMVKAAISTFGGVDTPSSYQAGLAFKAEEAAAAAQNARDWTVDAELEASDAGESVTIAVRDRNGDPVRGADLTARLAHPVDERNDRLIAIREIGSGTYRGIAIAPAGQWRLVIEISKNGARLFRSENRVVLR